MRIGFDITPLLVPRSGIGTYAANLLEALNRQGQDEILPLAHRASPAALGAPARGWRLNKTAWMQLILPWQLASQRLQVAHFTNNVGPVWAPCPTVLTIHDMTLWLYPQFHYRARLASMRPFIPAAARRAAAIITVSHSARHDIVRLLRVAPEKVHVIAEAPEPTFRALPAAAREAARRRLGLPERFVLFVGTFEPRKNLVRLLEAFARVRQDQPEVHLVMAGQRGWHDEAVFARLERLGLKRAVRVIGHIPHDTLVELYNLAEVLAFPSLYEGFGLPVVEAMACGTPVLTTQRGGLAESSGGAAEYVEPTDVESIAAGLRRLLADADRRHELRARGLAHASRLSWAAAAAATRRVYESAAWPGPALAESA